MRKITMIRRVSLVVAVVVGAGFLLGTAAARNEATLTDLFNPYGIPNPLGVPMAGAFLDPGSLICPGHTPTGDPMVPCPEGSSVLMRGFRFQTRVDSENANLAGAMTVKANVNFAADYTGPAWGDFAIQLDAGGVVEGTWSGFRRKTADSVWVTDLRVVGHGLGGDVDGKQVKCVEMITELTPSGIFYKGVATCRILDPGDE